MGRWKSYTQKDTQWTLDGDNGWQGIDMFHDPGIVAQGYLTRSENKRLLDGAARRRPATSFPADFNPPFANYIIGSAIYSNPNGEEVMLVATAGASYVWALQFGKDPQKINLNDGPRNTGFGLVDFAQAFDKVFLLRRPFVDIAGTQQPDLAWDGTLGHTFDPVVLSPEGLNLIPRTWQGEPFQDRLLLYSAYVNQPKIRDTFYMTDVNDYSSYDRVLGTFRINSGEADMITRVMGYFKGAALILMLRSIHLIENFTTDPMLAAQRVLSARVGSVGNKLPLMVGREVYVASEPGGIYALSELQAESISTEAQPVSLKINPVIKRINWEQAHYYGCSNKLGPYGFFAFPIDGATGGSNAIFVLNTTNREWESAPDWWDDAKFRINALHVTQYSGRRALYGLDYAAARIYLLYDDGAVEDSINSNILPVRGVVETRGYTANDPASFKRFQRAIIGVSTYAPDAVVTAISDGHNERKELGVITKDRTRFYPHAHPPYDKSTDPNEPKREDYSTGDDETNFVAEDFEGLPEGPLPFIPATSLVFNGVMQQSLERFQVRQNGRWCKLRVEDNSGLCDVIGAAVESIPAQETFKVVA